MTGPNRLLMVFIAVSSTLWGRPAGSGLEIYWCDVEGGAATLIVTPARESLLVDSGFPGERDSARIAKMAREVAGIQQIDHYITSALARRSLRRDSATGGADSGEKFL